MFIIFVKFYILSVIYFFTSYSYVQGINYEVYYENQYKEDGISHHNIHTVSDILDTLNSKTLSDNHSLQERIEYVVLYGALLRNQVSNNFGQLIYDHYQDYSVSKVEAFHQIYQQILERKFNIFDIFVEIFKSGNISPSNICAYMLPHVPACLKQSSAICANITVINNNYNENIPASTFQMVKKIYQSLPLSPHSHQFSLATVLNYVQTGRLKLTLNLLLGLLYNVQYDNFDNKIRTAERHVINDLYQQSYNGTIKMILPKASMKKYDSLDLLLKHYLMAYSSTSQQDAIYLSQHIHHKSSIINENIELLGYIYEEQSINVKYLFELILPNDTLDTDVIEARDYLQTEIEEKNILKKYLKIPKYQYVTPDELLLDILSQTKDIRFRSNIASSLLIHARFWRKSHMIENIAQLLELFDAFDNLRHLPNYSQLIETIDQLKNKLIDMNSVSIVILCTRPRACLQNGLKIVSACSGIDDETIELINHFLASYDCKCLANANTITSAFNSVTMLDKPITTTTLSSISQIVDVISTSSNSPKISIIQDLSSTQRIDISEKHINTSESVSIEENNSTLLLEDLKVNSTLDATDHESHGIANSCEIQGNCEYREIEPITMNNENEESKKNSSQVEIISSENTSCDIKGCSIKPDSNNTTNDCIGPDCTSSKTTTDVPDLNIAYLDTTPYDVTASHEIEINTSTIKPKRLEKVTCYHRHPRRRQKLKKLRKIEQLSRSNISDVESQHSNDKMYSNRKLKRKSKGKDHSKPNKTHIINKTSNNHDNKRSSDIQKLQKNSETNNTVLNATDMEDRLLDLNMQKLFNFEIKRDEVVADHYARKRHVSLSNFNNSETNNNSTIRTVNKSLTKRCKNSNYLSKNNTYLNKMDNNSNNTDVRSRLLDLNAQKFFNFEIKRDETVSSDSRSKRHTYSRLLKDKNSKLANKTNISTVAGLSSSTFSNQSDARNKNDSNNADIEKRMLDWNTPKFFNFEIKRDEIVLNNGTRSRRDVNELLNNTTIANSNITKSDKVNNGTDTNRRILDLNAQKFINFEIKRDETVSSNSRSKRHSGLLKDKYFELTNQTNNISIFDSLNLSAINHQPDARSENNSINTDMGKHMLDNNTPKFGNSKANRDKAMFNNGTHSIKPSNAILNSTEIVNSNIPENNKANKSTDEKRRTFDWNSQKFFNFEIKGDEITAINNDFSNKATNNGSFNKSKNLAQSPTPIVIKNVNTLSNINANRKNLNLNASKSLNFGTKHDEATMTTTYSKKDAKNTLNIATINSNTTSSNKVDSTLMDRHLTDSSVLTNFMNETNVVNNKKG